MQSFDIQPMPFVPLCALLLFPHLNFVVTQPQQGMSPCRKNSDKIQEIIFW
jgi:hypothetical protein